MSGLSYETVAAFAQQGGAVYFSLLFLVGVVHAFRPKNKAMFQEAARAPLDEEPNP